MIVQCGMIVWAIADIKKDSEELLARQRAKADLSCLPKIHPSEISREISITLPVEFTPSAHQPSLAFIEAATNGVGKFSAVIDASRISQDNWPWLVLGAGLATSLGFGTLDYEQAELYRSERGSGFP